MIMRRHIKKITWGFLYLFIIVVVVWANPPYPVWLQHRTTRYENKYGTGPHLWSDGEYNLNSVEMRDGSEFDADTLRARTRIEMEAAEDEDIVTPAEGEYHLYFRTNFWYRVSPDDSVLAAPYIDSTTDRATMLAWTGEQFYDAINGVTVTSPVVISSDTQSGVTTWRRLAVYL